MSLYYRRPKRRAPIYPDQDLAYLTLEQTRLIVGYSRCRFKTHFLPNLSVHGLMPVIFGEPSDKSSWRIRTDDLFLSFPKLDPYRNPETGVTSTWLERMKAKAKSDMDAHLAQRAIERATEIAALRNAPDRFCGPIETIPVTRGASA